MRRPTIGRIPWGMLGAIVLIVSIEQAVERHRLVLSVAGALNWRSTAYSASHQAVRADVLAFGDSLTKFGIQPRVIEAETGLKAYNLAGVGSPPSFAYFMLERAIRAGAKPKFLIVNAAPHHTYSSPDSHVRPLCEFLRISEAFDYSVGARDASLFLQLLVTRFLPSARSRLEIRRNFMTAIAGEEVTVGPMFAAMLRNWNANLGSFAQTSSPHAARDGRETTTRLLPGALPRWTGARTFQGDYMDRFLDLAESSGIRVFLVVPPMHPDYESREAALGIPAVVDDFLRMTRERHPKITILDGRQRGYDHSLFCEDMVHLNSRGASAFTRDVAAAISARRAGQGRDGMIVTLPTYREYMTPTRLESFSESYMAISKIGTRR